MNTEWLTINGLRHRVITWGKPANPKLFIIHGWLDTAASFHFFAQELQDEYFLVAPDLRGYGLSEHASNPLGYFFFEYVADLRELFRHFSPEQKVCLLGHSLGGAIASIYAGIYPERVAAFINAEGFGFQRQDVKTPPQRAREWLEGIPVPAFPIHPSLEALAKRLREKNPRISQEVALFIAENSSRKCEGGYQTAADAKHRLIEPYSFSFEIFYSFWKAITAPALFIGAEETEMAKFFKPGEFEKEMAQRRQFFPRDCRYQSLPNSGHMMHQEKPKELAKLIKDFLQSD